MKKIFALFVIAIITVITYIIFSAINYGKVSVSLTGEFNPVSDRVYINDERVFPEGSDGRQFSSSVRPNEYTVKVVGPLITSEQKIVQIERFQEESIEINVKPSDSTLLTDPRSSLIERSLHGFDSSWLFISKVSANQSGETVSSVYAFSYEEGEWKLIEEGAKINAGSRKFESAPQSLVDAVEEFAGD
jgi:hypothetical protein